MTSITDTGDSWLRQKSSLFNKPNNNNNNAKPVKVLDKELAQLKNRGVVSSVWSNKFVQNNSSGENISSSAQLPPEPLSPRRPQRNISPRPNAAYIPAAPGSRQTFDNYAAQIHHPTSPTFSSVLEKQRTRTLSGTNRMAHDIQKVLNKRNNSTDSEISLLHKLNNNSVSSLDLTEDDESDNRFSVSSSTTSTSRSTLTKEVVKPSVSTPSQTEKRDSMDTKAALWFEIETLKTRYAQSEARLKKATEDIDFYKRQMQFQSDSLSDAIAEKEQVQAQLKSLAEIIMKQDDLLFEYEKKLDALSSLSSGNNETMVNDLRQELDELHKKKNYMEGAISAMRGELEMSYSQMRLMMVVSTEIQDEFDAFKVKSEQEFKETLSQKQLDHDKQVNKLQEEIKRFSTSSDIPSFSMAAREIAINSNNNNDELNKLRNQVEQLTKLLKERDDDVLNLEMKLKTQKMDMESQLMVLNKTIVEKDSLLLEVMSQRNNSDISIIDHVTLSPPDSAYQSEKRYTDAESYTRAHLQFDEIRRYMASSDEEDYEDSEPYQHHKDDDSLAPQSPADSESSMLSSLSFESASEEKVAEIKHFSYTSVHSQPVVPRPISDVSTLDALAHENTSKSLTSFLAKENSASSKWPMPPPTPPPSEPLPPVPPVPAAANTTELPTIVTTAVPPPRRGRSNTLVRSEIPAISTTTTTSKIEISNTLSNFEDQRPIPPPRKSKNTRDSLTLHSPTSNVSKNITWMDDPEEEENWSMANQQWTAY